MLVRRWVAGDGGPTPADCGGWNGAWTVRRGERWINWRYGHTLGNHFSGLDPSDRWDCGNGSHTRS